MEQYQVFEAAAKYTEDSIESCCKLVEFIQKRQQIENEYSRSLRKLCKSISLTPFNQHLQPKRGWFSSLFSRKKKAIENSVAAVDPMNSTLWNTFYEIIDDTAQVAKSHTAFSESLQHQLFEPLNASLKEMCQARRQSIRDTEAISKELYQAAEGMRKMRRTYEKAIKELSDTRLALDNYHATTVNGNGKDLEQLQQRLKRAEEAYASARSKFRQSEEEHKNIHSKLYSIELPKIMTKLQLQESQRSREALSYILGMVELERRCALMNENYANDMGIKMKQINLTEDERQFYQAFLSTPVTPPPMTTMATQPMAFAHGQTMAAIPRAATPVGSLNLPSTSANAIDYQHIPRSVSMPPSYDSQEATTEDLTSAVAVNGSNPILVNYATVAGGGSSHHDLMEVPSQP